MIARHSRRLLTDVQESLRLVCHQRFVSSPSFSFINPRMVVIHLVRTHEGGRESSKCLHRTYKGEGVDTSKYVRKSPFLQVFCYIFICKVLLSHFVVVVDNFHYCFIKYCYDYVPVSLMFCCLFVDEIIDWISKNIPIRNRVGLRWVRVRSQWLA